MEDTTELEIIIRSLLVSSAKVLSANKVLHDFEESEGKKFPYRQLGFSSFVDYLKSIPSVVKLQPPNSNNPEVHPIGTEKSKHIDLLVTKQKRDSSRKSNLNKQREIYTRPPRRRVATVNPSPVIRQAHQVTDRQTYHHPPNRHIQDQDDRFRNQQVNRQTYHSVDRQTHLSVSRQTYHLVDKQIHEPINRQTHHPSSRKTHHPVNRQTHHPVDGHTHHSVDGQTHHPVDRQTYHPIDGQIHHPLGELTDLKVPTHFDVDFLENIVWDLIKKVARSKSGIKICDLEKDLIEKYNKDELERNGIYCARDLLNHASTMVKWTEEKVYPSLTSFPDRTTSGINRLSSVNCIKIDGKEVSENANSLDGLPKGKENKPISEYTTERLQISETSSDDFQRKRENEVDEEKINPNLSSYDYNNAISTRMISNFRKILVKYPEGILASELPDKYCEEFGVDLDISDLGFSSAINMVVNLPNVFTHKRIGESDWKLYDACTVKQTDILLNQAEAAFSESFDEKNRYIPKRIFEDIKSLVDQYPKGFRSTELINLYESHFSRGLDLEKLGFDNLNDFLQVLKKIITLRKVTNYYLLLPKHSEVLLDVSKSKSSPVEILKLPIESFSFPFPDNVVKDTDIIPLQHLPPINNNAAQDEPLIVIEVRVAEVMSPENFHLILSDNYNELQLMMDDLDKFYTLEEDNYHISSANYLNLNLFCACKFEDCWHRVKITKMDNEDIYVEYIDYGTPAKVKRSELRFLQNDYAKLPSQAICAKLMGLKPPNGRKEWPKETCHKFLEMVSDKRLLAHVYKIGVQNKKDVIQVEVLLFDTNHTKQDVIINEDLVHRNLAEFVNMESECTRELQSAPNKLDGESLSSSSHASSFTNNCQRRKLGPPPGFEHLQMQAVQQSTASHNESNILCGNTVPSYFSSYPLTSSMYSSQNALTNISNFNTGYSTPHIFQPVHYSQSIPAVIPGTSISHLNQPFQIPYIDYNFPLYGNFNQVDINFINSNNFHINQNSGYNCVLLNNNLQNICLPENCSVQQNSPSLFLPPDTFQQKTNTTTLAEFPKCDVQRNANSISMTDESVKSPLFSKAHCASLLHSESNSFPIGGVNSREHCIPSLTSHINTLNILTNTIANTDKCQQTKSSEGSSTNELGKEIKETIEAHKKKSLFTDQTSASARTENNLTYEHVSVTKDAVNPESNCFRESTNDLQTKDPLHINNSEEIIKETPDSWENIKLDDTPSRAEYYDEDLRNPLDFDLPDNPSKEEVESYLIHESKNLIGCNNWKQLFNPDLKNELERCAPNLDFGISSNFDAVDIKEKLVCKIEINKTSFHLIYVNSKLAVLSQEFYTQVSSFRFNVLLKILLNQNKQFHIIHRSENLLLFSKLEKIKFCAGLDSKQMIKMGKASISYLTDIPEIFIMLKLTDENHNNILKGIKEISQMFKIC